MSDLHLIETLCNMGIPRDMAKRAAKSDKSTVRYLFCNLGDVFNPEQNKMRHSLFHFANNTNQNYNDVMAELFKRLGQYG